jgi:tripartite-type tricarboxylate transporter receptor subunit TctC
MAGKLSQSGTRKGGANGIIAAEAVKNSKPDGLPHFVMPFQTHAGNSSLYDKLPYNPTTDFAAITHVANLPFVLKAQIRGRALARMTSIVQYDDNAMLRHWA